MDVSVGYRLRAAQVCGADPGPAGGVGRNQSGGHQPVRNRPGAAAPYRIMMDATDFNVSLDYIFGLCQDPRGRYVCITPEGAQEVVQRKPDWSEFVEACFMLGQRAEPPPETDDPQYGRRGKAQVRRCTP